MSEQTPNLKLTGKDLINIGIFSAIYFVLSFIGMFLAIIPVLWIIMPGIIAILAGIPFMLLCAKVQKPGVPLLMGLITGLLYYVTGQFTMVILATFVIGCVLSEIVRWRSKYGCDHIPQNPVNFFPVNSSYRNLFSVNDPQIILNCLHKILSFYRSKSLPLCLFPRFVCRIPSRIQRLSLQSFPCFGGSSLVWYFFGSTVRMARVASLPVRSLSR